MRVSALALLVLLAGPLAAAPVPPLPRGDTGAPVATREAHTVVRHGETVVDDYFWMRNRGEDRVTAHLEAENAHAARVLAPYAELGEALYNEIVGRIVETDTSVPYRRGAWLLYSRTEEGRQYPIFCRRRAPDAPEEVVLDLNALAEGKEYVALDQYEFSDDGNLLAYSIDESGSREYQLHVLDLRTREHLPHPVGFVDSVEWSADGRTLFYVTHDEAIRSHRLWRFTLGSAEPELVFEEPDELYNVGLWRSRSRELLFAGSFSARTSEVSFLRAADPAGAWTRIADRRDEVEYYPEHQGGRLLIRTNDTSKLFRIVSATLEQPGVWAPYLEPREGIQVSDIDGFARHVVITERERGLVQYRIVEAGADPAAGHRISFPETAYDTGPARNHVYDTDLFRFTYQSPVNPPSVYDYAMGTRERTLLKQVEVRGGYDFSRLVVERVDAVAPDGVRVPLTIVRRRDVPLDGSAPGFLYGYGSYGAPLDPWFSVSTLSMLDRGVVCAIAHIRGGGELGEAWHIDGRMERKRNTFYDFIACAEHLFTHGYTSSERLVIQGESAGGLLMGAVLNLRPDLAAGAIVGVPFVDVLNTMSDASLPLTVGEYVEWGNPAIEAEYRYMRTYCPYTNLGPRAYPAIFAFTSLNDSNVPYWEAAKWVARLRAVNRSDRVVILECEMGAGHGGPSGRYSQIREVARRFSFAFAVWGIGF